MNSFKIAKELIFIADCVNSKIAKVLINAAEDIVSFDMTEREWKEYHKQHPNADKSNHHIIPVPGKEHHKSDHKEYMKREKKAKKEYFKKMKQEHPNYVPIVPKDKFLDILEKGEYSCISAGINGNDPKDVENAKNNPDFILLGIDRDEPIDKVQSFIETTGISYPMALDPGANIFALYAERNAGITRNVLIGKDGKIVMLTRLFKEDEFNLLVQTINQLLKE